MVRVLSYVVSSCVVAIGLGLATPARAQDAKAGEKLFADQKCAVCHSIAGKGNVKGPLDDVGSRLPAADLSAWLTDAKAMTVKTKAPRKPEMKAYTLEKNEVDALVAYLLTLKKK